MNGNKLKKTLGRVVALSVPGMRRAISFLRTHALTETGLVWIFFLLFSTSAIFLDTKIGKDLDPDTGKNWWTLSFETRDPGSLEFAIENHSGNTDFSYEITREKVVLDKGTVSVEKGERKIVSPLENGDTAGRTTVVVGSKDGSKKSIYRER